MNSYVLIVSIAVVLLAATALLARLGVIQKDNALQWLVFAVTEAEKALGSGTGQLKLRYVYDLFAGKFPVLSRFLSFAAFSDWVDIALDEMRFLLTDERVKAYVKGGVGGD
jgi:hypothetical protein